MRASMSNNVKELFRDILEWLFFVNDRHIWLIFYQYIPTKSEYHTYLQIVYVLFRLCGCFWSFWSLKSQCEFFIRVGFFIYIYSLFFNHDLRVLRKNPVVQHTLATVGTTTKLALVRLIVTNVEFVDIITRLSIVYWLDYKTAWISCIYYDTFLLHFIKFHHHLYILNRVIKTDFFC